MALLAALRPRLGGLLSSSQSAAASWRAAAAKQGAKLGPQGTTLSTAAVAEAPETYTASAAWLHWLSAAGFVTCIVTVQVRAAQVGTCSAALGLGSVARGGNDSPRDCARAKTFRSLALSSLLQRAQASMNSKDNAFKGQMMT